jgi:CelD/BcsL family acetyltransferase involved in cellulose biosynthesis
VQISVAHPSELGPDEIEKWHCIHDMMGSLANPFLCPEFAVAVGRFRPGARVAVLADGQDIVGFFPFERRRFGVGVPIAAGLTDCQGLVSTPAAEWDPRELLRACRLSVWQFDHLTQGQQPFARYASAVAPSPVIDLANGYPAYQEKLRAKSPQFCRDVARKARRLEREAGDLRFVVDSRDTAELRALIGWKSAQYRRNGWVDVFSRPWITDLVHYLFTLNGDRFGGLLSLLYAGDTVVAGHFGLRSRAVLAHWFPAYDPLFGRQSPGLIQHLKMAQEAAVHGVRLIDMGTGGERYKHTLKSHDIFVAEGVVARGPLHAGMHQAGRAATGWARRRARHHPLLFRLADSVLRRCGRIG